MRRLPQMSIQRLGIVLGWIIVTLLYRGFHPSTVSPSTAPSVEPVTQGNYAQSANLFWQACKEGNADGCTRLAQLYEKGWGVLEDQTMANYYLQLACDSPTGLGCFILSDRIEHGIGGTADHQKANELFWRGCRLQKISCLLTIFH